MDEFDRFVTIMRGMEHVADETFKASRAEKEKLEEPPKPPKLLPKPLVK